MTLKARLRLLSLDDRQDLARAQNARIRVEELRTAADEERIRLRARNPPGAFGRAFRLLTPDLLAGRKRRRFDVAHGLGSLRPQTLATGRKEAAEDEVGVPPSLERG